MKLRTRFTLLISALVMGILLIAAVLVFIYQDKYLIRKTNEYHVGGLDQFTKACVSSTLLKNNKEFLQYAYNVAYSAGMAYGAFYSPDGTPVFYNGPGPRAAKPALPDLASALKSAGQVDFFDKEPGTGRNVQLRAKAVKDGNRTLGVAVLSYYPDVLKARRGIALRKGMRRFVWAGLIAILLILLLAYHLGLYLTEPIYVLVNGARAVGKGDLAHRIPVRRSDEIGELAGEFNKMAEKLQELDCLKEDFIANVTHDLRSPTTSIMGFSDMLLSGSAGQLSPKQEQWVETIRTSAQRLAGMINHTLDIAKLEAGMMKFLPESVPVGDMVEEAIGLFQPIGAQRKIEVSARIQKGVPAAWVDPDSLRQVLTNLLSNAMKFTPENGRVLVEVTKQKDGQVMVSVSDTGPGIPKEALPKLFTKFFQVDVGTVKGTGLGLNICKGMIESQRGKIWAASENDRGATFSFTLPSK